MRVLLSVILGILIAGFAYESGMVIPHQTVPQTTADVSAKVRSVLPPSLGGTRQPDQNQNVTSAQ